MTTGEITIRVRYAETDRMGLLHHANYLVWFEQGRVELFRAQGYSYKDVEDRGFYLVLTRVEVKYRRDLADFFRFGGAEKLTQAKERWPDLYFVFVTDHPAASRSCFQAMCLRDYTPGEEPKLVDLHQFSALDIYPGTVAAHEMIAQGLFAALASARRPARRATPTRVSESSGQRAGT